MIIVVVKLVALFVVAGCSDPTLLADHESVSLGFSGKETYLSREPYCTELSETLYGTANGQPMTVEAYGGIDHHVLAVDECEHAWLSMPPALVAENPSEVAIEIGDESAVFGATYPDLFATPMLELASTERLDDGRLVARFSVSPPTLHPSTLSVRLANSLADGFSHRPDNGQFVITFPLPERVRVGEAHELEAWSELRATSCAGFTACYDVDRSITVPLDPALLELAAMP